MKYSLTVLMTTYNCDKYIAPAIKSILNQTYKDFEFLIIDDGSTDDTQKVVSGFNDNRIRYIKRQHFGRAASLNFGLNSALSEIIALMDADDISHPERLDKQLNMMTGDQKRVCFTFAAYFSDEDVKIKFVSEREISADLSKVLALHGFFCNSTAIFYKNHILNYGYDERLNSAEDYDLLLRLRDNSKFILIPDVLQFARIKKNSLSNTTYNSKENVIYKIQEPYFKDLLKSFRIEKTTVQQQLQGWREFFYGNKALSRGYWYKINLLNWDYRMYLAFLISILPKKVIDYFKNQRIRLRLKYQIYKITKFKGLEKEFRNLLREVSQI